MRRLIAGMRRTLLPRHMPDRPKAAQSRWASSLQRVVGGCALALLLSWVGLSSFRRSAPAMEGLLVLKNSAGVEVHILPRGAIIQSLLVPDKNGQVADIVLGFDEEQPYKVRRCREMPRALGPARAYPPPASGAGRAAGASRRQAHPLVANSCQMLAAPAAGLCFPCCAPQHHRSFHPTHS